jgi:bifunctional DNA-binding transcriptional regulator/antitoxin component of YhaV-PrlF toxin-antitoxin module
MEAGKLVIPASIRSVAGIAHRDTVVGESPSDRELRVRAAIREAQEIVRRSVSQGRSLADELMRERRR